MKRLVKISMLAGALAYFGGHLAYGLAKPVVGGVPYLPLFEAKTAVGVKDGMLRVIWDYNPAKFPALSSYAGSALWLIDPNGTVFATGNPTIPATVGGTFVGFPFERSNLFISAQASGNTTVVFVYPTIVQQFGVWTYNSAGTLISAASYGPFSGAFMSNFYFNDTGKLVIKWRSTSSATANAVWVLNEFGGIDSATAFFDFPLVILGKVLVNSKGQQVWPYSTNIDAAAGPFQLTVWTFNPTGSTVVNANVSGPF